MFELGVTLASAALSVAVPNCDCLLGKYEEYVENTLMKFQNDSVTKHVA
jgi:hypothetical protein